MGDHFYAFGDEVLPEDEVIKRLQEAQFDREAYSRLPDFYREILDEAIRIDNAANG